MRGATLLEFLVALGATALLVLGAVRFLAGALQAAGRVEGSLEAQRSLRRAVDMLSDDVLEGGLRIPYPGAAPPGPPFTLERDRPLRVSKGYQPTAREAFMRADELTILKDQVLPGQARLAAPFSADTQATVTLVAEGRMRPRRGDLLVVEDGRWEAYRVEVPADLEPGRPGSLGVLPSEGGAGAHTAGTPVLLVRPQVPVTYALALPGPSLARIEGGEGGTQRLAAPQIQAFAVELPGPSPGRVRLTLEAGGQVRRTAILVLAPRNPP